MRKSVAITAVAVAALGALVSLAYSAMMAPPRPAGAYVAILSGENEVPPVETDAIGLASFVTIQGNRAALYSLLTHGLTDVTAAHIHLGAPGENGPPVAFLFMTDEPVTQDGLLAAGVLTADDLIGPLEGAPLSDLLEEIAAGNTYVNVHTLAHPGGEIRGQVGQAGAVISGAAQNR